MLLEGEVLTVVVLVVEILPSFLAFNSDIFSVSKISSSTWLPK